MAEHDAEFSTTIGPDASFSGKLQFEKGARLLGAFEGEISTKGQLVIANGGKLAGEASAGNIRVEGQVNGNLNANGKIHLAESARLEGDIQAAKLEVAEGAVLVGRCSIGAGKATDGAIKAASASVDKVKPMRGEAPIPMPAGAAAAAR
jgi:cytoskeletal protein CcmA (bactofilin family)